ncbi:MAG: hypothetical protein C4291_15430 [Candidatus Dadabacteria bacterium]
MRKVIIMNMPIDDIFNDLDQCRVPDKAGQLIKAKLTVMPKARKARTEFLKGPIPLPWLLRVMKIPSKAPLAVALAIWFEAGRRRSNEVKLTTAILNRFNVNRKAKYRALKMLEEAGLIRVYRKPRCNPVVTILEI